MKLSIAISALLIAGLVAASTEQAGAVVYCQYVAYPAGCTVRAGVVLRPRPVGTVGGAGRTVFCNAIRQKPNQTANFGELSDHFLTQRVDPAPETGDGFEHQFEARAQLLEQRPHPCIRFVSHRILHGSYKPLRVGRSLLLP